MCTNATYYIFDSFVSYQKRKWNEAKSEHLGMVSPWGGGTVVSGCSFQAPPFSFFSITLLFIMLIGMHALLGR